MDTAEPTIVPNMNAIVPCNSLNMFFPEIKRALQILLVLTKVTENIFLIYESFCLEVYECKNFGFDHLFVSL